MPREPRHLLWSEEACFHIFNRGHNRETVFRDDNDRRRFLDLCKRYRVVIGAQNGPTIGAQKSARKMDPP